MAVGLLRRGVLWLMLLGWAAVNMACTDVAVDETFVVGPGQQRQYAFRATRDGSVTVHWTASSDFNLIIRGGATPATTFAHTVSGSTAFEASKGVEYQIVLDNSISVVSSKTVQLRILGCRPAC